MKVFKIALGIIILALGFGMAWAGWAMATYGQWSTVVNIFIGFVLAFFGLGIAWSGIMLIRGSSVRGALGGMVTALPGHKGIGLHRGDTHYVGSSTFRDVLPEIIRYTIIAIVIILIAIFSVGRILRDFRVG